MGQTKTKFSILVTGFGPSGKSSIVSVVTGNASSSGGGGGGGTGNHSPGGISRETLAYEGKTYTLVETRDVFKHRDCPKSDMETFDGVIFVVDAAERRTICESEELLSRIVADDAMNKCPILIFLNKCDMDDALSDQDIVDGFSLHKIRGRRCNVFSVSARVRGKHQKIVEGFEWLLRAIQSIDDDDNVDVVDDTIPAIGKDKDENDNDNRSGGGRND